MEFAVLRLLHLSFGGVWVGAAMIFAFWLVPSANEAGPGGGAVMRGVVQTRKLPLVLMISGWVTVIAGFRLYMLRFSMPWLTTPEGIVLTAGALLALGGLAVGMFAQRPTAMKLAALGAEIAAAGKPPTPEQAAQLAALQAKLARVAIVVAAHLGAALVLMSAMRLALVLSS